jgi:hypothetical protein
VVCAKGKVEELCPYYIYNYSLANERFTLVSAQAIDNPVMSLCFSPMKPFLYTYHVDKKQIGITPFCDDNAYPALQESEAMVEGTFEMDVNKLILQGDKLYAFSESGSVTIYEAPIYVEESQEKLKLNVVLSVQTHSFLERGVAEGAISLDGSQIIAVGFDGTFSRIRLM